MAAKETKPTVEPVYFVDDNGYAFHKACFFGQDGKIHCTKHPSIVVSNGTFSDASGKSVNRYQTEGTNYSCPKTAVDAIDIRNNDYPLSPANRVLVNHMLAKTGNLGVRVALGVTLPFRDFYSTDGKINSERREAVSANFSKPVEVVDSQVQPNISSVSVWGECISAFFDWAIQEDGSENPEIQHGSNGPMAVIDIGGQTTDIAALSLEDGNLIIDNARSGTKTIGVLDAIQKIQERGAALLAKEGCDVSQVNGGLPRHVAESILQTGKAHYMGERDFSELRSQVLREQAEAIIGFITSKLGQLNNYHLLYFIGGGAIVFREMLEKLVPFARFSDEFANAKGALKYMRYVSQPVSK